MQTLGLGKLHPLLPTPQRRNTEAKSSWSVITTPGPGKFNLLLPATSLSDGTVAAVGFQKDFASPRLRVAATVAKLQQTSALGPLVNKAGWYALTASSR